MEMLKLRIGLSRKKRLPTFKILSGTFLPHKAISTIWKTRNFEEVKRDEETVTLREKSRKWTVQLLENYAMTMIREWGIWNKYYLPNFSLEGKTVLDVGAGCGETALFYFLNGASKIFAIEPNEEAYKLLLENKEVNDWDLHPTRSCFDATFFKTL